MVSILTTIIGVMYVVGVISVISITRVIVSQRSLRPDVWVQHTVGGGSWSQALVLPQKLCNLQAHNTLSMGHEEFDRSVLLDPGAGIPGDTRARARPQPGGMSGLG